MLILMHKNNKTGNGFMAHKTAIPDYDWDEHFQIMDDLRQLDLYYLQLTGKRPLVKGNISNHLIEEFTQAAKNKQLVPISEYYQRLSSAVERMMIMTERHANLSASRSHAICNHLQDMARIFTEERFHPFIKKEMDFRGTQLRDLYDNLALVHPLYMKESVVFHDDKMWGAARQAMEIELDHYKDIAARGPLLDKDAMDDAFLGTRSLKLAKNQERLAAMALDHAKVQAELVEECLRLATTMRILPDIYRVQLEDRMNTLVKVASDVMVSADFTLCEAADLRNSAQLSRNLQRPIFKAAYP